VGNALALSVAATRVFVVAVLVARVIAARTTVVAFLEEPAVFVALRFVAIILDAAPANGRVAATLGVEHADGRALVPAVIGQAAVIVNSLAVATVVARV